MLNIRFHPTSNLIKISTHTHTQLKNKQKTQISRKGNIYSSIFNKDAKLPHLWAQGFFFKDS